MTPGVPSLRDELRASTAPLHRQAEAALAMMDASMSLETYRSRLLMLHSFYRDVEPTIVSHAGWAELGIDMRERRKLPLLASDLAFVEERLRRGEADTAREATGAPITTELDSPIHWLASFPAALGAAYVLEGSTLGGAILYRHLSRVLDLGEGPGARFFHCYGEETGTRWKQFVDALNRAPLDAEGMRCAVAGAVGTFGLLIGRARAATAASPQC